MITKIIGNFDLLIGTGGDITGGTTGTGGIIGITGGLTGLVGSMA